MKKILVWIMVSVMGLALIGCGVAKKDSNTGGGADKQDPAKEMVGYYKIIYMEGDLLTQDEIDLLEEQGIELSLTLNEDGTAILNSIDNSHEMTWDAKTMKMQVEGETLSFTYEDGVIRLEEDGEMISFRKADKPVSSQTEPATEATTQAPVSGSDAVKFQLTGIDDDLSLYVPTGVDTILLTESGKLTLMTYGTLASNEGSEVTIATDVQAVDIFNYGNAGYRVILFLKNDGSISEIQPDQLIQEQRIQVKDHLGGLTGIVEIYEENDMSATCVYARGQDGSVTMLDPFF